MDSYGNPEVTIRGRVLGDELRRRREAAGLTKAELARQLRWLPSKVSRMESGRRVASELHTAIYLATCQTPEPDIREALHFLYRRDDHWLEPHAGSLSGQRRILITHEAAATAIHDVQLAIIPDLLQTEDYTRALLTSTGIHPPESVESHVRTVKTRQLVLHRDHPPRCTFFLHENALRTTVGTAEIMNEQLLHLVLTAFQPQISIRVIPAAHATCPATPFRLLHCPDQQPVTHIETGTVSLFLENRNLTRQHRTILDQLRTSALDPEYSQSWIARAACDFDST
ncbi:MAG TPA: helix-turn-helix transcriptional regulator [Actinophytocola sp.]|uniref:helix-turn-helix domain-containing protein n=1 Tax=Actinophytocola sp. TaxID=1872138 RepID=UPI002DDC9924|nr:helix-turn-helix transcriptional regulator [Actinophytocola sp.]HEV2779241.1 helix-turn-helix transcriptional regulator [Actinophytocola sp.]